MPADFEAYFRALATVPIDEKTEHTDRAALESLLRQAADDVEPGALVQHEPRRDKAGAGSPDFKITRQGRIAGYVETKQIDDALSKVVRSDQIKKYCTLSDNLIVTDYLEFVWLRPDAEPLRERLAHSEALGARHLRLTRERADAVRSLLRGFFSAAPQQIGRGKELALALAGRAAMLRDFLSIELQRQAKVHQEGRLHALFDAFKRQIFHELTIGEFADAFAQMLAYGLFLARLNARDADLVTLDNVRRHIPGSFALIRELVRFLEELNEPQYDNVRWVVEEVLSIVNGIDLTAIQSDLSFRAREAMSNRVRAQDEEEHRLFERDPFIYFYEDFLKAYDPAMRKSRGVYYTPPPVVNFIVSAIDDILKDTLKIKNGLADHNKVTLLDFACGTGTFLLEVFERVFETIGGPKAGRADQIVREHFLKNMYGFEYLIAPYTIAHLKLSQYLKDRGHSLSIDDRLQIFLTNTLEPVEPQRDLMLPALTREVEEAQAVKEKPILVITGNPPYSGHSKNKGEWIRNEIAAYRKGFPELSKPAQGKWLQDDYVKFIRFAQIKMDAVEEGVVGLITNHSWLDNPTFKGMRQSLMATFDQIYVLDLHGNAKKKERAPDGSKDENVFQIEQGVAIGLFVKSPSCERGVWHGDLWGKQLYKYQAVAATEFRHAPWQRLEPKEPDWRFVPQNEAIALEYRAFWTPEDIFSPMGAPAPGFATQHDDFAISFSDSEAIEKVRLFLSMPDEATARQTFRLCAQDQWRYERARDELARLDLSALSTKITYRPFDDRWTIWDRNVATHRRTRISNHLLAPNVALVLPRNAGSIGEIDFDAVSVSTNPVELNYYRRGGEFLFPAYLYEVTNRKKTENLSPQFRSFLDSRYGHHYTPEEILGYIYAVLYSPHYRSRYSQFLRIDFPRIPFPENKTKFDQLSDLGWALVQAHLLRDVDRSSPQIAEYHGRGDHAVDVVRWSSVEETVWINNDQRFAPVPAAVWDFHIGGYRVLDKYLKSRKGRALSLDETTHFGLVAEALAFTIAQMARIDGVYSSAFPNRG